MDVLINSKTNNSKFIFVVGPTASGKSAWALKQAVKFHGSILNIDSVQFYEGLQIGSAAPSPAELQLVPHYLYSYIKAPQEMTAGQFLRDFYQLLENQKLRSPVFIVGGTGFYIQALEKGMYDVLPTSTELRETVEKEISDGHAAELFAELSTADPKHKIHFNDHYRIGRAIELLRQHGKTPTELKIASSQRQNKNAFPFPFLKLGFNLAKEVMLPRVEARTQWMIENGLIEETQKFLQQGFGDWSALASVGYKETVEHLLHNNSKAQLAQNIVSSTMKLIKKQKTWFKRDASVLWSDFSASSLLEIEQRLDQYLTAIDHGL